MSGSLTSSRSRQSTHSHRSYRSIAKTVSTSSSPTVGSKLQSIKSSAPSIKSTSPSIKSRVSAVSATSSSSSALLSKSSDQDPVSPYHDSLRKDGLVQLSSGNYLSAISLFTKALAGTTSKDRVEFKAALYRHRCMALYKLGGAAYKACERDARMSLEGDRICSCERTLHALTQGLHLHQGPVLRSEMLSLLGYSLLRRGIVDGVADAFEGSIDEAKTALLRSAEDRSVSTERTGSDSTYKVSVDVLNETIQRAKDGLGDLGRYNILKSKLDKKKNANTEYAPIEYLQDLTTILDIAPASLHWNIHMVHYLIYKKQWFAVSNYCEQMASKFLEVEKIFEDDLRDQNPFYGIPPAAALSTEFFKNNDVHGSNEETNGGEMPFVPIHLRKVNPDAALDVVFRLPDEILPHYLSSLRLEDRLDTALSAVTSLIQFEASSRDDRSRSSSFSSQRVEFAKRELPLLKRTKQLKDEGDALYRESFFESAAKLYADCLQINSIEKGELGGKLNATLHSNLAACYSSLGRYQDAIVESSKAINVHNMFMKALLRRARCYAKVGDISRSREDYKRWIMLAEGAKRQPYPPKNSEVRCFFDMPSEVSSHEWNVVKSEMIELGTPITVRSKGRLYGKRRTPRVSLPTARMSNKRLPVSRLKCLRLELNCFSRAFGCSKRKNTRSRQEEMKVNSYKEPSHEQGSLRGDSIVGSPEVFTSIKSKSSVKSQSSSSFMSNLTNHGSIFDPPINEDFYRSDPPNTNSKCVKAPPMFEQSLDPPSVIDADINYYAILELDSSASPSDVKKAYYRLAKLYHPDRNTNTRQQFLDVKLAYSIIGDSNNRVLYDKRRAGVLEP